MVTLQKMPMELQAFFKQQKPAWPENFVLAQQVATHFSLPGPAARSYSALTNADAESSQHITLPNEQLEYCHYTMADVGASKMRLKACSIGRLLIPPC